MAKLIVFALVLMFVIAGALWFSEHLEFKKNPKRRKNKNGKY